MVIEMQKVVLIGAGGHAGVVVDILNDNQEIEVIGATDKVDVQKVKNTEIPVLGEDYILVDIINQGRAERAIITVGGDNSLRKKLFEQAKELGYQMINAIHRTSVLPSSIKLGAGNVVMAGAIINPGAVIGDNNIINTGAIIEHDIEVGDHVHISPGAILAGGVKVRELSHIGLGAKVIEGVTIGRNCLIGAGAVIIDDVPDNSVVVGVPGRIIKKREASSR